MTAAPAATWLFVPGDQPTKFEKASASGADEIIIDLEDAVATTEKSGARQNAHEWLSTNGKAWIRINASGTPWYLDDVSGLVACKGLKGFMLPKAEDPDVVSGLGRLVESQHSVVALVESALGIANANAIAACEVVDRLAFGSIDFALDIDAADDFAALLMARSTLVVASRAANLPGPIDGVTMAISDPAAAGSDARRARMLGFRGKLCIHPAQIEQVAREFRPSESDLAWAQSVLKKADADTGAVAGTDGQLIDRPVIARARRIVELDDNHS